MKHLFRALYYRNYRLFFMGQGISLIGNWMQTVATGWLVFRMTDSPFLMGLVNFSAQIPTFLCAPFAGVLLDRWQRRRVLLITQALFMLQAFALALLTLSGIVQVWHIVLLNIVMGIVTSFDMPGRQSFVNEMIEKKEDLGNAIALNSSIFNGARMIGPSIAGIIIARIGEGMCFLLNAVSFLAVLAALLAMNVKPRIISTERTDILDELKKGVAYAFGFSPIRSILLLLFLTSMMGMPVMVLMPIFSKKILMGGPETLGFLMAASGVGALIGAMFLAWRRSVIGLGRLIPLASGIFGLGLIAFSFSRNLYLSLILGIFTGFGMMVQMASSNTLLQTIVDEDKRGRVMSLYTTSFMGAAPLGSLMAGALANKLGAPLTVMCGGIFCIAGALLFARNLPNIRKMIHPIYVRMGIMPEK
jgi:MFS family permease